MDELKAQILNNVYNNLIDSILARFPRREHAEIKELYKKYLEASYGPAIEEGDEVEKTSRTFTTLEEISWEDSNRKDIRRGITVDEALNKLGELSAQAEKFAQYRLGMTISGEEYTPQIDMEKAKQMLAEMTSLFDKVKPFNKDIAKNYLSEGSVDLAYATQQTDNMSFRVGRMM